MNKADLVDAIARATNETKATCNRVIDSFIENVTNALRRNERVSLVGFGTFETHRRKATTGRNPQTGASINIPASNQAKFRPGKALKDALN